MTTDRARILQKNVLFEGWSRIVEYVFHYRDSKGRESDRSWEVCERPEAASVLVYDRDLGSFVLVRQFRVPVFAMGNPLFYAYRDFGPNVTAEWASWLSKGRGTRAELLRAVRANVTRALRGSDLAGQVQLSVEDGR